MNKAPDQRGPVLSVFRFHCQDHCDANSPAAVILWEFGPAVNHPPTNLLVRAVQEVLIRHGQHPKRKFSGFAAGG